jgi:hypothetical protein
MIVLVCYTALGFAAGFVLRLSAFAALLLLAVVGYAVISSSFEGSLSLAYHAVLVGISGQIGYFVAIVTQAMFRSRSKGNQIRANSSLRSKVSRDSHEER